MALEEVKATENLLVYLKSNAENYCKQQIENVKKIIIFKPETT